jgi:hypothetical protein
MRLRFRKRIPLLGHVYANLGLRGVSLSWRPVRGVSVSRRGISVGIPGTGISVQQPWVCPNCGHRQDDGSV